MSRRRATALAAILASGLLTLGSAHGQEPDREQPPAGQTDGTDAEATPIIEPEEIAPEGIESIAITGEQFDVTDVQDEAQAITSFSMDDLDKLNISNVDGLAANVPGLHVGQQGQAAIITLRGIGTENASLTGESGVAFHVDGIYYSRPTAARVAFFDLQKIDVKRGPQGLLGGKNSTSGSINVVTNDPSTEYEVSGDILFGNYDRVRARGHLNIPLGEFAAVRAAFFHENRDGYLDNQFLSDSGDPFDADNFGLRTKLRLMPADSLNIVFSYNYFQESGNGPQSDLVPILSGDRPCGRSPVRGPTVLPRQLACAINFRTFPPSLLAIEDPDPRKIWTDEKSNQDNRYWGGHGRVEWEARSLPLLGETTLELRGGYQRTETTFNWDFDGSNVPLFPLDTAGTTHEYSSDVRWGGLTFGERLTWQASLFFQREKGNSTTVVPATQADQQGRLTTVELTTLQAVENKSYGAALHGELLLLDNLTFSLGGRWIKDRKRSFLRRISNDELETCEGGFGRGQFGFPTPPECELTDRGTAWGARLEYRPLDDHLMYAGIDRGHKSGGFGLGGTGFYNPEKIWAYVLGTKSEFFDRRVQINAEGFFYAYEGMQIALIDGTSTRTENSDTRMYGWEVEATAVPIPGLTLRAVVGYLNTETRDYFTLDPASLGNISEDTRLAERKDSELFGTSFQSSPDCVRPVTFTPVRCGVLGDRNGFDDFSGNQLSRAPEWKYTLSAEYEISLGNLGTLTPRVQWAWQDESYQRVFNRSFDLQEDYHITDAKITWRSLDDRWQAEVFVENIENEAVKDFILIGTRAFSSPPLAWYNEPRFYGFRVGFRY